jgi:hypothetical protein
VCDHPCRGVYHFTSVKGPKIMTVRWDGSLQLYVGSKIVVPYSMADEINEVKVKSRHILNPTGNCCCAGDSKFGYFIISRQESPTLQHFSNLSCPVNGGGMHSLAACELPTTWLDKLGTRETPQCCIPRMRFCLRTRYSKNEHD